MTPRQLAILNALVTFAAENIPGGLNDDEQEVAQIVGHWVLSSTTKTHNYKVINPTHHANKETACNAWAEMGWRVVAVVSDNRPGYADLIILERPVGITHPDD